MRHVRHINGNVRFTIVNKAGRQVHAESFLERKLIMLMERDPLIRDYASQPVKIGWVDEAGKRHTYVPDFKVWFLDGRIEIREVTLSARSAARPRLREREEAARKVFAARGWNYRVYTEKTLPGDTETANLEAFYCFRSAACARADVKHWILTELDPGARALANELRQTLVRALQLTSAQAHAAMMHMIWHGTLHIDWTKLFLDGAGPAVRATVWVPAHDQRSAAFGRQREMD